MGVSGHGSEGKRLEWKREWRWEKRRSDEQRVAATEGRKEGESWKRKKKGVCVCVVERAAMIWSLQIWLRQNFLRVQWKGYFFGGVKDGTISSTATQITLSNQPLQANFQTYHPNSLQFLFLKHFHSTSDKSTMPLLSPEYKIRTVNRGSSRFLAKK